MPWKNSERMLQHSGETLETEIYENYLLLSDCSDPSKMVVCSHAAVVEKKGGHDSQHVHVGQRSLYLKILPALHHCLWEQWKPCQKPTVSQDQRETWSIQKWQTQIVLMTIWWEIKLKNKLESLQRDTAELLFMHIRIIPGELWVDGPTRAASVEI